MELIQTTVELIPTMFPTKVPAKYESLANEALEAGFSVLYVEDEEGYALLDMEHTSGTLFYLQIVPGKRTITREYNRYTSEDKITSIAHIRSEFSV